MKKKTPKPPSDFKVRVRQARAAGKDLPGGLGANIKPESARSWLRKHKKEEK